LDIWAFLQILRLGDLPANLVNSWTILIKKRKKWTVKEKDQSAK
jgi:hypothetical protein